MKYSIYKTQLALCQTSLSEGKKENVLRKNILAVWKQNVFLREKMFSYVKQSKTK